jgi:hypothetical protein
MPFNVMPLIACHCLFSDPIVNLPTGNDQILYCAVRIVMRFGWAELIDSCFARCKFIGDATITAEGGVAL